MRIIWTKKLAFLLIGFYILIMLIAFVMFGRNLIGFEWVLLQFFVIVFFAIIGIILFDTTKLFSEKKFIKNLFIVSFLIKIIVVIINYNVFNIINGFPFIMHSDSFAYHEWGEQLARNFNKGNFNILNVFQNSDLSDLGGKVYYGLIYYLFGSFGDKIIIARIFNAFFASLTVIFFYKTIRFISKLDIARSSAILFMLFPIFNLYVGTHFKESIFLFFIMLSIYKTYQIFYYKKYKKIDVIWLVVSIIANFFFRNVIGPVIIFSLLGLVLFNFKKKFSGGLGVSFIIIFFILLISYQSLFKSETEHFAEGSDTYTEQVIKQTNRNKSGKFSFGNLMSAPVMLIATMPAPFPSVVEDKTLVSKDFRFGLNTLMSSAFIKGFLAFWAVLGIFFLFKNNFKDNSYFLLFFGAYYLIISISGNGFIIRYLMPLIPFFIYFAVVGMNKYKKYYFSFIVYIIVLTTIILYYNYTKLNGFGVIIT